jgi:transcription elongation factor GreB
VRARGLALLRRELEALETERGRLGAATGDETERTRRRALNAARIAELSGRVASARVVDPGLQPHGEVRFGATVELRTPAGDLSRYTIVGVDEAAPAEGRIAFLAPLARAILGLRVGDTATLCTTAGEQPLEVESITYDLQLD